MDKTICVNFTNVLSSIFNIITNDTFKVLFPGQRCLGKFLLGMCHWPLRAPTPLQSILWPIIDTILVTFGQICNFCDSDLVTFYFYELTFFFIIFIIINIFVNWMKNTLIFTYRTNILVRLLTVNTPKNPKMCEPILVTILKTCATSL